MCADATGGEVESLLWIFWVVPPCNCLCFYDLEKQSEEGHVTEEQRRRDHGSRGGKENLWGEPETRGRTVSRG